MFNNFHQTPEEIVKAAKPEQKIMWNYIFLTWGQNCSVSQFYYQGPFVGSPLNTYNATMFYFAYNLKASRTTNAVTVSAPYLYVYNEIGVLRLVLANWNPFWDATAATVTYGSETLVYDNLIFSYLHTANLNFIEVTGFRIGR